MCEDQEYQIIFQRLPHIAKKMLLLWGSVEFNDFIDHLFTDTRDGKRQGLPVDVASAIFKLYRKHQEEHPETVRPAADVWSQNQRTY